MIDRQTDVLEKNREGSVSSVECKTFYFLFLFKLNYRKCPSSSFGVDSNRSFGISECCSYRSTAVINIVSFAEFNVNHRVITGRWWIGSMGSGEEAATAGRINHDVRFLISKIFSLLLARRCGVHHRSFETTRGAALAAGCERRRRGHWRQRRPPAPVMIQKTFRFISNASAGKCRPKLIYT